MGAEDPLVKQTSVERMINRANLNSLIGEYHLIQQKKSRLSRSQRDAVENRILYLVKMGRINIKQSKINMSFVIIKTIFTMTKIGKVLRGIRNVAKRVVLGGGDVLLPNLSANRDAPEGGEGKFDYLRLASTIVIGIALLGFLFGKVTMEQIQSFMEFLK